MKIKKLSFFLVAVTALVLLLAATSLTASAEKVAYPVEGGNIYFNTETGAIVGCDPTITRADIPEYIDGVKVTRIDKYAFTQEHHIGAIEFIIIGTPSLKYVSIPDTVRVFGASAFYGSSIDSLVLPDRNDLVFMIDPATTLGPFDFGTETVYYRGSKSTFGTMTYEFSGPGYGYFTTFVYDYKCEGIYGHEYSDWTAVKLPTCKEKGEDIRICSLCGESETRSVSARHTWSDVVVVIKPSCTTTGSGVRSCLNCDISQTVVIPVEHSFGKWQVIQKHNCIEGVKRRTCTICKAKEEEMLPATEDHSWSEWKEDTAATCTVEGKESHYCLNCNHAESRTTPTNDNHSWSGWVTTIAPTAESKGKEVRLCTVCNATESRTVPALCVTVSTDGLIITVCNLNGVKDYFIGKGIHDTYREVKNNSVMRVTEARINGENEYTYTVSEPGEYTVCVRFNDGSENLILYTTVTADLPEFETNGLALTVNGLNDIRVIRTAPGEWNTPGEVKRAEGSYNIPARNINGNEYVLNFTESGTYTVTLEYSNGLVVVEHIELTATEPTLVQDGNSVVIGNLDNLYTLRYAMGEYSTMGEIKRAEGCQVRRSRNIVDGVITVTNLEPGTYTFCVQYTDNSYHYFTVVVE